MILDKLLLWLDSEAYNATITAIDLSTVNPGPGRKIKCFITCGVGDMAGMTLLTLTDGATTAAADAYKVYTLTAASLNAGTFYFYVDADVARYLKIALTNASAGTGITAGVTTEEQTNS